MSSRIEKNLSEKLQYMDITKPATPGYVSDLGWWTEIKGALRALVNMIQGAWRMVMAPIRGVWRISNLGYEKLKSVFTDKPPNYDKVMSRSRRAFLKRSSEYREREAKIALYKKDRRSAAPSKQDSAEQKWSEEESAKTGWTVRGATKKWVRSTGFPTIKEDFVHLNHGLMFILAEDSSTDDAEEGADQEILDAIRADFEETRRLYEIAIDHNSKPRDIASLLRHMGRDEVEDSDLDFYMLTSTLDPEMPEEQRRWIGDETLKQIRSKILPRYISQIENSTKKSLKRLSRKYLSSDESFKIENLISTLSFK